MEIKRIPVKKGAFKRWKDKVAMKITGHIFALAIAYQLGWKTRERMSHNNGIGARGRFICNPHPDLPPNEYWEPGKVFPLRIRHAMATFYDDAMGAIRSISVKMADTLLDSQFDLNLNTGSQSLFWNAASFVKLATMRKERYGVEYQNFYRYYPDGRAGAIATLRRHATSFTNLTYYSKTPLRWLSKDGIEHYVKYRVVPYEQVEQSGMIFGDDLIEPENQRVIPGERLSRNYLKDEFTDRLKRGEVVRYRFQAQVRRAKPDDPDQVLNCCIDWPEDEYPYLEVGVLELTDPLSWDDSNKIAFSILNLHPTLKALPARSMYDPNSLNYFRAKAEFARKVRWFAYRVKGMPPPIPYDDYRNSSTIIENPDLSKHSKLPVWHRH